MINALEKRSLVVRMPHPHDGRAMGLHLTAAGQTQTDLSPDGVTHWIKTHAP